MADTYEQIYKKRDIRIPHFEVKVRGKDLKSEISHDIVSVRYSDSVDKIDSFELTVNNWDAKTRDFKYTGPGRTAGERNSQFDPGSPVELFMGYRTLTNGQADPLDLMLAGVITSIAPSFPAAGQPTMKVSAQNALRQLMDKQKTRAFEGKTDSKIAEDIATEGAWKIGGLEVKLRTAPKDEVTLDHILQNNLFDIAFLLQRAYAIGYDLVLEKEGSGSDTKLFIYFGPSKARPRHKYLLEWGRSLIQFDPTLTTTRQVTKVTVRYWDGVKKKVETVSADRSDLSTKGLPDAEMQKRVETAFAENEELICDKPFRNKQAAKKHAVAVLADIDKRFVTAKGSTFGTPGLRAGNAIQVDGLGSIFSGHYYLTSTTHTIGAAGYVTEFECRLEEENA
jgi:phage protein D